MKNYAVLLLLTWPLCSNAQFTYFLDQTIPVKNINGNDLAMPWAGGLNAAQYNAMDINGDDVHDLVLFDRMANRVITFVVENNKYRYAPEYESLFPEVTNWLLLRDFNCDGKKDIFTGDALGIKVYVNTTTALQSLQWDRFRFFNSVNNSQSDVLLSKGLSGKVNLQLQYDDLPSITDVDNDGDMDIMSFRYGGGSTVEYHKNFSIERYGTCDSLDFERVTQTFGNITECECGEFAFYGEACPPHNGERIEHAVGKALLVTDLDGDLDPEILLSEAACNKAFLLLNEGTLQNPSFNSAAPFPSGHPIDFPTFPAVFYEDVDFDGLADLVATPNIFQKEPAHIDLKNSNWLYKNTGSQQTPTFTFIQNNFMQDQMIDVGDNAVPTFADADGDGDMDLFMGQGSAEHTSGSIYFYENTGTKNQPAFKLITESYIDLAQLLGHPVHNIRPQFADINSDGRTDLIFTATNRDSNQTLLYYILNTNINSVNLSGQAVNLVTATHLSFSENVHLTDVNLDGLTDMLIGRNTGAVEYWKNNGPKGSISLALETKTFLDMGASIERQSPSLATADLNADGKADLVVGDQTGILTIVGNYREGADSLNRLTAMLFDPLSNAYVSRPFAGRLWPAPANLFNSNKPALVIGNMLGGVHLLKNDNGESLPGEIAIDLYPTLLKQNETLYVKTDRPASAQILSVMGQQLGDPFLLEPSQIYPVKLPFLAQGLYLVQVRTNKRSYVRRIIIY